MLCPVCRHDNLQGEDNCENCGADLRSVDIPEQAVSFRGRLLGEHLDELGVGEPAIVDADLALTSAIARMHEIPTDCLLATDGGRLVGIYTGHPAVVKAPGRKLETFYTRVSTSRSTYVLRLTSSITDALQQ